MNPVLDQRTLEILFGAAAADDTGFLPFDLEDAAASALPSVDDFDLEKFLAELPRFPSEGEFTPSTSSSTPSPTYPVPPVTPVVEGYPVDLPMQTMMQTRAEVPNLIEQAATHATHMPQFVQTPVMPQSTWNPLLPPLSRQPPPQHMPAPVATPSTRFPNALLYQHGLALYGYGAPMPPAHAFIELPEYGQHPLVGTAPPAPRRKSRASGAVRTSKARTSPRTSPYGRPAPLPSASDPNYRVEKVNGIPSVMYPAPEPVEYKTF